MNIERNIGLSLILPEALYPRLSIMDRRSLACVSKDTNGWIQNCRALWDRAVVFDKIPQDVFFNEIYSRFNLGEIVGFARRCGESYRYLEVICKGLINRKVSVHGIIQNRYISLFRVIGGIQRLFPVVVALRQSRKNQLFNSSYYLSLDFLSNFYRLKAITIHNYQERIFFNDFDYFEGSCDKTPEEFIEGELARLERGESIAKSRVRVVLSFFAGVLDAMPLVAASSFLSSEDIMWFNAGLFLLLLGKLDERFKDLESYTFTRFVIGDAFSTFMDTRKLERGAFLGFYIVVLVALINFFFTMTF